MTPDARIREIRERLSRATPGPWRVRPDIGSIHGPDGKAIQTGGEHFTGEEPWANAHLVANTPSDLEYLLDLLAERDRQVRVMKNALEEIKRHKLSVHSEMEMRWNYECIARKALEDVGE